MVTAHVNYGLIQQGQEYIVLREGYDWYEVRVKGKAICAYKWIFENEQRNRSY